ncbi:MAG: DedA family protein, partial [Bacilli bacterium]
GYLGIILALILEFLLIPFPAETILILSGILWRQGVLHLLPLLVFATVGSFVGSLCAYYIGFYVGRPVLLRYGRYVRLDEAKLDKAERAFEKYALPIVGLGRFIAGIRVLIAYVAGINKMPIWLYVIVTMISAALWSALFVLIGATLGAYWHIVRGAVLTHPVLSAAILAAVAALGLYFWRKNRLKIRKTRALT